jgi:cytochrome c heme-lyase
MRYVIDFYSGHNPNQLGGNLSFYLDVRPALDNWEGVKMRVGRFWSSWLG